MALTSGSPGSGMLEVGIALVLKDRFSNQAREASSQIKKLHMDAKNAVNANLTAIQDMSRVGMAISAGMGAAMGNAISVGAEFVDTMISVRAITNATDEELSKMGSTAKDLGFRTMFNAQDIASGMKYLAMAGTEAKDIEQVIEGAAMAANAVGMELGGKGGAADMITNVMRMFRIESAGAASVIGDQLVKATLSSNMSMYDLAEAVKYAGADMVNLKQNLPSVSAMIGTMANAGIQGSMAGTAIANMARYLNKSMSDPRYKGGKMLDRLGLSKEDFTDANGNIVDFGNVLDKIKYQMDGIGMDSTEQAGALLDIFGVRGARAASVITRDLEGYRSLLEKINFESAGFATQVVEERMESIAGKLNQMRESITNLKIAFTESIEPIIKPFITGFTWMINGIRALFEIPIFGPILSGAVAATTVILGVGSTVAFLRAKFLMANNDTQVSHSNMIAILKGGWKSATLSAQQYLQIQTAIQMQKKSSIGDNMAYEMMMGGMSMGGVKMRRSRAGTPIYYGKNNAGKTVRLKPGEARRRTSLLTPTTVAARTMGGAAGIRMAATEGVGTQLAKRGIMGRMLGGVGKGLSGIMALFGGPMGLAITAGFLLVPPLIGKIKEGIDSRKKNTESTDGLKRSVDEQIAKQLGDKDTLTSAQEKLTEEMKTLSNIISAWGEAIATGRINNDSTITINLEGDLKKVIQTEVKRGQTEGNYETNTR